MTALLQVEGLHVELPGEEGAPLLALRDLSFAVAPGETFGIVGESGSGKSMTALAVLGLLPPQAKLGGSVLFAGRQLAGLSEREFVALRGDRIGMIFQEPMTALNPVHTVGRQVAEPLRLHRNLPRAAAAARAVELLGLVGLPDPAARAGAYPPQLSGGQRQRVMIAQALACEPDLVIADEPTTALDASVQEQVLGLLLDLVRERGLALVLISHDLTLVGRSVDRVAVMYAGRIVEQGPVAAVFDKLAHPYSHGLFAARPRLGTGGDERLPTVPGQVPHLGAVPRVGCSFAARCSHARPICRTLTPPHLPIGAGHTAACLRHDPQLWGAA